MAEDVAVTICGIETTVPRWHFEWTKYVSSLTREQYLAQLALSDGTPKKTAKIFADYWKELYPE